MLFNDEAEILLDELLKSGRQNASKLILKSAVRLRQVKESRHREEKIAQNGKDSAANQEANAAFRGFCQLAEARLIGRVAVNGDEGDAFQLPELNLGQIAIEAAKDEPDWKTFDAEKPLWRPNEAKLAALARDQVICAAAARSVDVNAGQLIKVMLEAADCCEAVVRASSPLYYTDISSKVKAKEDLMGYADQYLKILSEESSFLRKIGDEGGGAYEVNFAEASKQLAAASIESVVLEKFGNKALRIFRWANYRL